MLSRRELLGGAAAVSLAALWHGSDIGEVLYCRVSSSQWLRFVPAGCVVEIDPTTPGATLLGSKATLAVGRFGVRQFASG